MQSLPFQRVLVTDFYDGPTEGFTECSECRQTYAFRKLDWDDGQDQRIMSFAPLGISLDEIAARLKVDMDIPGLPFVSPLNETDEKFVQELLHHPPAYVAVMADGWLRCSSIWRDIRGLNLQSINDWFSFFGISRKNID